MWQIEEMLKMVLVMMIFTGAVLIFMGATGGLNSVLETFCTHNPEWCGELPDCVCCEIRTKMNMGYPFEDYESAEYLWSTKEECYALLKDNKGTIHWSNEPEYERCGTTPNEEIETGIIFHEECQIPDEYISDTMPYCVCCSYSPSPGYRTVFWDMEWKCEERNEYQILNESTCGPLWLMPEEAQELTLKRINKFYGLGGQYCELPYPYNLTEQP